MASNRAFNSFTNSSSASAKGKSSLKAVQVLDEWEGGGTISGHQAIEKLYASEFASSPAEFASKLLQVYTIDGEICANSEFNCPPWKGYNIKIYTRDAGYLEDPPGIRHFIDATSIGS
jgi:hypothetical protein